MYKKVFSSKSYSITIFEELIEEESEQTYVNKAIKVLESLIELHEKNQIAKPKTTVYTVLDYCKTRYKLTTKARFRSCLLQIIKLTNKW